MPLLLFLVVNLPLRTDSLTAKFNCRETLFHSLAKMIFTFLIATTSKICTRDWSRENHFFSFNPKISTPAYTMRSIFKIIPHRSSLGSKLKRHSFSKLMDLIGELLHTP